MTGTEQSKQPFRFQHSIGRRPTKPYGEQTSRKRLLDVDDELFLHITNLST